MFIRKQNQVINRTIYFYCLILAVLFLYQFIWWF